MAGFGVGFDHGSADRGGVLAALRAVYPTSPKPADEQKNAQPKILFVISLLCCPTILCLIVVLRFRLNTIETCYNPFIQAIFEHNYWLSGS